MCARGVATCVRRFAELFAARTRFLGIQNLAKTRWRLRGKSRSRALDTCKNGDSRVNRLYDAVTYPYSAAEEVPDVCREGVGVDGFAQKPLLKRRRPMCCAVLRADD